MLSGTCNSASFPLEMVEMKPVASGYTVSTFHWSVFYPVDCVGVAVSCSPRSESVSGIEQEWSGVSIQ